MYWRISRFQELEHIPEADRVELLRRVVPRGTYSAIIIRSTALGVIASGIAALFAEPMKGLSRPVRAGLVLGTMAGGALVSYQWFLHRIRRGLIAYLKRAAWEKRLPMCLRCGYNLEGLTGDVCPECGTRIHGSGA